MRHIARVLALSVLAVAFHAGADQVSEELPDTLPGKSFGGLSGFMAGAAVGGPLGAIAGALSGAWLGGRFQEMTGIYSHAYRVRRADGTSVTLRSPQTEWPTGAQVEIRGNRFSAAVD